MPEYHDQDLPPDAARRQRARTRTRTILLAFLALLALGYLALAAWFGRSSANYWGGSQMHWRLVWE
jgi:hypothetical protein